MAASFWATLKVEFPDRRSWPTKAKAKAAVTQWISEVNNGRRHYPLCVLIKLRFELHKQREPATAA